MANSNVPFSNHFEKLKENPNLSIKVIIVMIISYFSSVLQQIITDQKEWFRYKGVDDDLINKQNDVSNIWLQSLSSILFILLTVTIVFIILLVISKIMKSQVKSKSLFSASLSYYIITLIFSLIVNGIQALFNLHVPMYQLDSLNIFQPGNLYLTPISIRNILNSFIFGLIFYYTSGFSKKSAFIWSIIIFIVMVIIGLIGAWLLNYSVNMLHIN
ncbi:Yip1-like protein [Staphylococcus epidermidis]